MIPLGSFSRGSPDEPDKGREPEAMTPHGPLGPDSDMVQPVPQPTIKPGIYRHFKGNLYRVLGVAPLVDSPEWFVVYRPLYGDQAMVLRPYSDFTATIIREGRELPRFRLVEAEDEANGRPHASNKIG